MQYIKQYSKSFTSIQKHSHLFNIWSLFHSFAVFQSIQTCSKVLHLRVFEIIQILFKSTRTYKKKVFLSVFPYSRAFKSVQIYYIKQYSKSFTSIQKYSHLFKIWSLFHSFAVLQSIQTCSKVLHLRAFEIIHIAFKSIRIYKTNRFSLCFSVFQSIQNGLNVLH